MRQILNSIMVVAMVSFLNACTCGPDECVNGKKAETAEAKDCSSKCTDKKGKTSMACQAVCGEKDYDQTALVSQPGAGVGSLTTCPASNVVFKVTDNTPLVTVGVTEYYVCCSSCGKRLISDYNKTHKI